MELIPGVRSLLGWLGEGCRLLLVQELLGQAMLSALGSCSQAGKQCLLPAPIALFLVFVFT